MRLRCFHFPKSLVISSDSIHFLSTGLKLTLFIDVDEYLVDLAESVGALVTVHSPYFTSFSNLDDSPIFVAPGTAVSVALNAVSVITNLANIQ